MSAVAAFRLLIATSLPTPPRAWMFGGAVVLPGHLTEANGRAFNVEAGIQR